MKELKSSDLRVGNWVNDITGGACKVRGVTKRGIWISDEAGPAPISDFSPIPITPEVLEKAGFEYVQTATWRKEGCFWELCHYQPGIFHVLMQKDGFYMIEINCLHQLQNLYHTLTGEELEIEW